jgi:hypothetical protein
MILARVREVLLRAIGMAERNALAVAVVGFVYYRQRRSHQCMYVCAFLSSGTVSGCTTMRRS